MSKWLQAAKSRTPLPDKTDLTDKTSDLPGRAEDGHKSVLSVLSVKSEGGRSYDGASSSSPARDLIATLQSDMEMYADALRIHGPMSYGQAMGVLGWGATRAGQAETDLRKAGRISFNKIGRAELLVQAEVTQHEQ